MPEQLSPIVRHFKQTADSERLDRSAEQALVRRWRERHEPEAMRQILWSHARFVTVLAARYRHYHVSVDDLVSEGNIGLLTALEKFDPDRDIRFATYAGYWVRAKMVEHVLASWSMAPSGAGHLRSKLFFRLRRERARALAQFGEGPAADHALSQRLDMSEQRVRALVAAIEQGDVSLERPAHEARQETLGDTLASETILPEQVLDQKRAEMRARQWVAEALVTLDKRERFIATRRLMAPPEEEASLAELGRLLGVTRERARQLESRTKAKLKKHLEQKSRRLGASARELLIAA